MTIRKAEIADVPVLEHVVRCAYEPYIARIGKPPGPMLDDYRQRVTDGQAWVLETDGKIAGLLVLEDAPDGLLLDNIAVAPAMQGKGFGRRLVAFAEAEARRRGNALVRLYTHVLMTENIALYSRLGFAETGRVNEKGFDRVYMAKHLDAHRRS